MPETTEQFCSLWHFSFAIGFMRSLELRLIGTCRNHLGLA